jgi:hypothetical protein
MGWRRWVRRDSAHPHDDRCGLLGDYRDTLPYHETQLAMPTVRQKAYGGRVSVTVTPLPGNAHREPTRECILQLGSGATVVADASADGASAGATAVIGGAGQGEVRPACAFQSSRA